MGEKQTENLPKSRFFKPSGGILQKLMLRYCKAKVEAKNCLKVGVTSLVFFDVLKWLRDRFKCVNALVQPRTSAGKRWSNAISVLDKSKMARTLGWAKKEFRWCKSSFRMFPHKFKYVKVEVFILLLIKDWLKLFKPLVLNEQWLRFKWCMPLGSLAITCPRGITPLSSRKLQEKSNICNLQRGLAFMAWLSLTPKSQRAPIVDKCNSCKLMDLATTPRILSHMSLLSLELLPLARNLVNHVLCSKALTVNKWNTREIMKALKKLATEWMMHFDNFFFQFSSFAFIEFYDFCVNLLRKNVAN